MSREAVYATLRDLEVQGTIHIGCAPDDVADDVMGEIANVDPAEIPDRVSGLISSLCNHGVCVCDGEDAIVAAART